MNQTRFSPCLPLAALTLLAWTGPGMAEDGAVTDPQPVALIEGQFPVACGFSGKATVAGTPVKIEVLNRIDKDGARFVIAAEGAPRLKDLSISAGDVVDGDGFSKAQATGSGRLERFRAFSPDAGAIFIHALMVFGGTFRLTTEAGQSQAFQIAGPLPHNVRYAYLNCAGDLVRPEE